MFDKKKPPVSAELKMKADVTKPIQDVTDAAMDGVSGLRNLGKMFGELTGLGVDSLRGLRERRGLEIQAKLEARRRELGIDAPKQLGPGAVVRMLGAATLEDDEKIREMWANLLASAQDPNDADLGAVLPDILGRLSRLDAELLLAIEPARKEDYEEATARRDESYEKEKADARKASDPDRALQQAEERDRHWREQLGDIGASVLTIAKVSGRDEDQVRASLFKLRSLGCVATAKWSTPSSWGSIGIPGELEVGAFSLSPVGEDLLRRANAKAVLQPDEA